jgi:hypothetical protein
MKQTSKKSKSKVKSFAVLSIIMLSVFNIGITINSNEDAPLSSLVELTTTSAFSETSGGRYWYSTTTGRCCCDISGNDCGRCDKC